jgi:hypothetical protein
VLGGRQSSKKRHMVLALTELSKKKTNAREAKN